MPVNDGGTTICGVKFAAHARLGSRFDARNVWKLVRCLDLVAVRRNIQFRAVDLNAAFVNGMDLLSIGNIPARIRS